MNRTRFALVAFTFAVVMAFAAAASATPSVGTLEFSAGYAKSATEIGTSTETMGGGVTFGGAYWRNISPMVSWGAEISYDNIGTADATTYDPSTGTTYNEKFSTKILRVNPALRVKFGAPVGPAFFAQGGLGLYNVSWDYDYNDGTFVFSTDGSDSNIGFNLGAGVGFPMGPKTKLNISGNYHVVPGVEESGVNLTDDTNYLQFRAGIAVGL